MARLRIPGFSSWEHDPLWATVYDWSVEHPMVGRTLWRAGVGTSLQKLYDAADEIGKLPAGAAVLDIPCGGGVALRGVRVNQGLRYIAADISQQMLDRTMTAARERRVDDQVEAVVADVHRLQFSDGEFDLVVSFTGLHCFPDPHQAIRELGRVTKAGGALTGSTILEDISWRSKPIKAVGTAANVLGPGLSTLELEQWLADAGYADVRLSKSGAICYFRATRA